MQQIEKFQKDGYLSLLMLFACVHSDVFKTNVLKFFLNWNQSDAFKTANWIPILDWKVFLLNPDRDYIWMLNRFCSYGVFFAHHADLNNIWMDKKFRGELPKFRHKLQKKWISIWFWSAGEMQTVIYQRMRRE